MSASGPAQRWAVVRATAEAALARPLAARAAFLNDACGDDVELHADVVAQIRACECAASSDVFMAESAAAFAAPLFAEPHGEHVDHETSPPADTSPLEYSNEALRSALATQYDIVREQARGGMATVYLARDRRHERLVAIKVFDPALGAAMSAERFLREIRITAALTHPHILPLHDSGEAGGLLYYVMPFVEGETLRERLARERPLALETALRLIREVASALAYAHRHGVVHRDIKPANILLEDGHAVVADFGIARAMRQAQEPATPATLNTAAQIEDSGATATLTHPGTSPGTPAYMAPEQARGDGVADHRADLYALGVIAYEALADEHPFGARTPQALVRAHQNETPPSLAARRPDLPPAIAALVMQLLAKDPAARPQSATAVLDLLGSAAAPTVRAISRRRVAFAAAALIAVVGIGGYLALSRVAGGGSARGAALAAVGASLPPSLAVLSFENTSGDTTFDYLQDGITDRVRDALNGVPGLTVKARSSSRALTGHDAREVGAKLGVGAVLQGTVSRSSSHLHVTAELVRASDDVSLWSSTFDGEPSSLAEMQDTIARAVAGKLRLAVPVARSTGAAAEHGRGSDDIEAYDLFLRGRYAFDRLDFTRASKLFGAAVARDPRFARAHAYLAMSYANTPTLGSASVDSMNALARESARRAMLLDSTVAEAYAAESFALMNEMRLADAVIPLKKAVALDSNDAYLLSSFGLALAQLGRVQEGLVQARRAIERDPMSGTAHGLLAYSLELARQYPAAVAEMRAALDLDPKNALMHQGLGFAFAFNGMPDSAVTAFEIAYRIDPEFWGGRSNLVFGYAAAGRWKDAARQRTASARGTAGNSPEYHKMVIDLAYGDDDAAMTALERGVKAREPLVGLMSIPCDPLLDPLKSSPRFAALMRRLGAQSCPATGRWPIARRTGHAA